ncbi:BTB domain-containing protein [Trichonephila inaurata madagascariensis]|uniref:BTB domain-containing protein n=1 Tax=Trichonephila inaurata madagascariensis TaxID=2747483 RepID=A0A8X6YGC2_9ARAC|nr:BTB domain-containing protein [Trichonephila inaurata madagascariensis]
MPKCVKKKTTVRTNIVLHTRHSGHECEINWTIDNVLQFPEEEFISKIDLGRSCKTRLNFTVQVLYKDYFSDLALGIERTDKTSRDIKVLCNVSIENSQGDAYTRTKSNLVFKKTKTDPELNWFTDIKFVDPDHTNNTRSLTENDFKSDSSESLRKLATKELIVWDEENRNILYILRGHSITIKGMIKVFACCVNLRATPINENRSTEVETEVIKTEVMKTTKKLLKVVSFLT